MSIRLDGTNTTANPGITGGDADTGLQFGTDEISFVTGGTEQAKVDSSGRLLVGTSTPRSNVFSGASGPLTPQNQIETQLGSWSGGLSLINNSASGFSPVLTFGQSFTNTLGGNGLTPNGEPLGVINFTANDGTNFRTGAAIEARTDNVTGSGDVPGRLTFSTTADGASSPTERMRIANDGRLLSFTSSTDGHGFRSSQAASTSHILIGGLRSASSTTSGTFVFVVRTNGQVENSANSYGALSDAKLKENIVDANPQWNDIKRLQVRRFNFIEGDTHTQIGLIAQEVESISPGLVSESVDKDENGNDLETTTKSIKYSVLYMKAVKALQEAMERIETLEAKVAALEANP